MFPNKNRTEEQRTVVEQKPNNSLFLFSAFRQALEDSLVGPDPNLESREMKLRQMIIEADSPFIGKSLIESKIRDLYSCMVVGLEEGKESLSPFKPNRKFQEGDIIWVVGEEESLNELLNA